MNQFIAFFLVNFEHVYMQNKRYHSCALFSQQITINNVAHEIIIEQNTIHLNLFTLREKQNTTNKNISNRKEKTVDFSNTDKERCL